MYEWLKYIWDLITYSYGILNLIFLYLLVELFAHIDFALLILQKWVCSKLGLLTIYINYIGLWDIKVFQFFYNKHIIMAIEFSLFTRYTIYIIQALFIAIITIWSRAAGPRFRLDQLLSLTWKDLFIYLSLNFVVFLVILILV